MNYLERIKQLVGEMRAVQIHSQEKNTIKNQEFKMLLGAPQALIRNADFYATPIISRETAAYPPKEMVKEKLQKLYNITNYDSAVVVLEKIKGQGMGWMYQQFVNDWKGEPTIKAEELETPKRVHYESCREFAKQFQEIVGKFGLVAWDISMAIDIAREVYTAGYFSEQVTLEFAEDFASHAAGVYPNWEHYAIGVICGAAMYDYRYSLNEKQADEAFDFMYSVVKRLFTDKAVMVWNTNRFMEVRRYFKNLKSQVEFFSPELFCIVSTEIASKERPVGYFYRESPNETNVNDTGWRFFAGDETNRDVQNLERLIAVTLNVMCNYDAAVMPLLESPAGSAFIRNEKGEFTPYIEEETKTDTE
ncbi:MAG: DUF2185 domain-containing protein [Oscillospiraceae bacterium]|jgi:hypothetical protein|nr:DUF2185 domain-containing protein [Oscillospiraceae bacterium]